MRLYDHDLIEEVNLGPQSWPVSSLGRPKVEQLAEQIAEWYPDAQATAHQQRCPLTDIPADVLFFCVDSIETRTRLFGAYREDRLIFDARVAGEIMRILSSCDAEQADYYAGTLFRAEEAYQAACTTKMTVFSANIAAGLLMGQYSKLLRQQPTDRDLLLNLQAMVLTSK
jgi:sulfur carrier protein ThiS adenylyltransferase